MHETLPGTGLRLRMIDNFDSFVHTIVGYLRELGAEVSVERADRASTACDVDGVLISPGPGTPAESGRSLEAIAACAESGIPMLGVCLGHQALAHVCGGTVGRAATLMHGMQDYVTHDGTGLFAGLPQPLAVARYHSLVVTQVPADLQVTARSTDGTIMALAHRTAPLYGVQFHPESILTEAGHELLANWLRICRSRTE